MSLRRGGRFRELVARQLDLFASDEEELLAEIGQAEAAWTRASREQAEDSYGNLQLVLDAVGDGLLDLRERYAATLQEAEAREYRSAFTHAALRRFGRAATLLEDDVP